MSRTTDVMKLVVFTIVCKVVYVASVTCKDMNGIGVDWYYVYKLPKINSDNDPFVRAGVAFYYLDDSQQTFQKSTTSIEDVLQPIAQTLNQIYNQGTMVAYIMYNEAPPNEKPKQYRGHTKGVVAYDHDYGFWMIHSVPKFPPINRYTWATNGNKHGQSILCVTFKSREMKKIAKQMMFNYPYVYNSNLPPNLRNIAPTFQEVVNGGHVKNAPWSSKVHLSSRNGQDFIHYAKFKSFHKDLYLDLVAKDLGSNLQVETWQKNKATNRLPSECSSGYCVENILGVRFPGLYFRGTKDHSKWAVSNVNTKIICVGDINREVSQLERSGGTLCSNLPKVWAQYNNIVDAVEPVPVPGR